jgi:hypothetical protein
MRLERASISAKVIRLSSQITQILSGVRRALSDNKAPSFMTRFSPVWLAFDWSNFSHEITAGPILFGGGAFRPY